MNRQQNFLRFSLGLSSRAPRRLCATSTSTVLAFLLPVGIAYAQESGSKSDPPATPESAIIAIGSESKSSLAMQRGITAIGVRDWDTAVREFEALVKSEPENVTALDFYGMALLLQGQAEKALPVLQESAKRQPDSVPTLINLGNAYLARPKASSEDLTNAVAAFDKAVALKPASPDALTGLGTAALKAGDYPKAESAYRALLAVEERNTKDDGKTQVALGYALQRQGKTDEAVAALKAGLELKAEQPDAWAMLGAIYLQRDEQADAQRALGTARQQDPNNYSTASNLGQIYATQKRYADAAPLYQSAAEIAAKKGDTVGRQRALYNQAESLHQLKDDKSALAVYDTLLAEEPGNYNALMNSASLLYAQGSMDKAVVRFNAAAAQRPDSADPWEAQGKSYEQQGHLDKSVTAWARAAMLTSDKSRQFEFYQRQAANLLALRRYDELRTVAAKMKPIWPDNSVPYTLTGLSYQLQSEGEASATRKQRMMVQALQAFEASVKKDPRNAQAALAYNNIGVLREKRGEVPLAIAAYKKALTIDPQFMEAQQNLNRYGGAGVRQPRTGTIIP